MDGTMIAFILYSFVFLVAVVRDHLMTKAIIAAMKKESGKWKDEDSLK